MIIRYYLKVIVYLKINTYWKKKGILSNSISYRHISMDLSFNWTGKSFNHAYNLRHIWRHYEYGKQMIQHITWKTCNIARKSSFKWYLCDREILFAHMKKSDMTERLCTYHKVGFVGKEVKRNSVTLETLINMYCFSLPHFSSIFCQYHALLSSSFHSFINPELSDSCHRKDNFRKKITRQIRNSVFSFINI